MLVVEETEAVGDCIKRCEVNRSNMRVFAVIDSVNVSAVRNDRGEPNLKCLNVFVRTAGSAAKATAQVASELSWRRSDIL